MKNNISPIIYAAIERIGYSFGGTEVKLLSEEMYRRAPDEFCALGRLGVDIEVDGIKTFLGCGIAEDMSCGPYSQMIADEFVWYTIKYNKIEL